MIFMSLSLNWNLWNTCDVSTTFWYVKLNENYNYDVTDNRRQEEAGLRP